MRGRVTAVPDATSIWRRGRQAAQDQITLARRTVAHHGRDPKVAAVTAPVRNDRTSIPHVVA
jgi:hypothetical protein